MRQCVVLLAAFGLAALLLSPRVFEEPKTRTSDPSRTARARRGTLQRTLRVEAFTLATEASTLVAPKLTGSRVNRDSGDLQLVLTYVLPSGSKVRKGDKVAAFDAQFMETRIDDLHSSLIQQQAFLRRLQASLGLRRVQQLQRERAAKGRMDKAALDLKTAAVRSAMQVERYRMNLEESRAAHDEIQKQTALVDISERASMRRSEIDLEQIENELRKAERNRAGMTYLAPRDGVLLLKKVPRGGGGEYADVTTGDVIGPGQAFAEIVDVAKLRMRANINQADLQQVHYGQKAVVRLDGYADLELPAKVVTVTALALAGRMPTWFRVVPIRLELLRDDRRLLPQLTGSVEIVLEEEAGVVVAPRECVQVGVDGKPYAWVSGSEGWIRRTLELGLRNHFEVAVRAGLEEGDVLAIDGPATSRAGSRETSTW